LDGLGCLAFHPSQQRIEWKGLRKVAVLRLDHLGDVILALPAVQALEKALPEVQVDLLVGPWAKDIVERAGLRSSPRVFATAWFARGTAGRGVGELAAFLRAGGYDAAIELRGDFRHIWAMTLAGIPRRVGVARTGLGFLLTHPLEHRKGLHECERNFDSLEQAGIPLRERPEFPRLFPTPEDDKAQREAKSKVGITRPVIALHGTNISEAKRWPADHWGKLIEGLPRDRDIVLIGTEGERPQMEAIAGSCERKVFLMAGLLGLPGLAAFLRDCELLIGLDSGPAHIAAAVGTPVLSLYSGTNLAEQWAPRGPRVRVLQKKTPCSPCERQVCPFDNECMRLITVEDVLGEVGAILRGPK